MKRFLSLGLAVILMLSISISAFAAENENITATLDRRIKVTYNGELQTFTDANGKIVYPIVYQGTTYLPVRAASALVKLPVEWDGANYTVVLGGDKAPYEAAEPVGTPLTESENIKTVLDKNTACRFTVNVDDHIIEVIRDPEDLAYFTLEFLGNYLCDL